MKCPKCEGSLENFKASVYTVGTNNIHRNCEWVKCTGCFYVYGIDEGSLFSIERRMMTFEELKKEVV